MTLAEAAVLARHANARVTAQIYAGVSDEAKTQIAAKLVKAGLGSDPHRQVPNWRRNDAPAATPSRPTA